MPPTTTNITPMGISILIRTAVDPLAKSLRIPEDVLLDVIFEVTLKRMEEEEEEKEEDGEEREDEEDEDEDE